MQSSRRSREKDERTLLHFDTHRLVLVSTNFIITIIQVLYFFWCVLSFAFPILSPFSAAPSLKRAENRPRWVAVPLFFAQNFPLCLYPRSVRARGGEGGASHPRLCLLGCSGLGVPRHGCPDGIARRPNRCTSLSRRALGPPRWSG